jgi:hypothetical protein
LAKKNDAIKTLETTGNPEDLAQNALRAPDQAKELPSEEGTMLLSKADLRGTSQKHQSPEGFGNGQSLASALAAEVLQQGPIPSEAAETPHSPAAPMEESSKMAPSRTREMKMAKLNIKLDRAEAFRQNQAEATYQDGHAITKSNPTASIQSASTEFLREKRRIYGNLASSLISVSNPSPRSQNSISWEREEKLQKHP